MRLRDVGPRQVAAPVVGDKVRDGQIAGSSAQCVARCGVHADRGPGCGLAAGDETCSCCRLVGRYFQSAPQVPC